MSEVNAAVEVAKDVIENIDSADIAENAAGAVVENGAGAVLGFIGTIGKVAIPVAVTLGAGYGVYFLVKKYRGKKNVAVIKKATASEADSADEMFMNETESSYSGTNSEETNITKE